ncbi:ATPase [Candidatus Uhrbacteria bacterium RIFCSPLOWO2_02_FULL_51_9]|uniref:ATPase n=1 Tax=Candidatus Uhrbacteria bacterium RIFCSPLOWO2_02_FULL_51_9 TaxID=1802410 RepID=A0A1F7VE90_9BACT|nr:MAG: ATPase [Candidatus Uhrbacteria bacterium RIFCSPLOWO2_02_FULL_51_9]
MPFINREQELKVLNEKWQSNLAQFFIIYGKRRVGKTELIKQFINDKPAIYFLADKRTTADQLRELGQIVGSYFKDEILIKNGFGDWIEVFSYLKTKTTAERLILAIDEYPYLTENDKSTSSLFQKGWDEYLKNTKIFLILSGSSIAMMESETLNQSAPLFGRRTGQILVDPLNFSQSRKFFPEKNFSDFLNIYTITGGMPAYLKQFEGGGEMSEEIKKKIFNKTAFLYNEVEFTLKEELRETKNYLAILRAIALGKKKLSEIVNEVGLDTATANKYLSVLINLRLVEREVPITEDKPDKSRRGLYKISDNFFVFWFQYIFPYKSYLEMDNYDYVLEKMFSGLKYDDNINSGFKSIAAQVYERVAVELLIAWQDKIFAFERMGRYWDSDQEIDVVGFSTSEKKIIFGECKWSEKPVGINIYEDLKKKAAKVEWNKDNRKEYYILFSKSGFTEEMIKIAKNDGVVLVEKDVLIAKGASQGK